MNAVLIGSVLGFLGAIPVAGPISFLVLERVFKQRHRSALALAFGGSVVEAIWCWLAFLGVGDLLTRFPGLRNWSSFVSIIVPAGIAIAILWTHLRSRGTEPDPPGVAPEARNQLSKSVASGLVISAINPMLLASWSTAAAWAHGVGLLRPGTDSPVLVALGVVIGINAWFFLLVLGLRRFRIHGIRPLRRAAPIALAVALLGVSAVGGLTSLPGSQEEVARKRHGLQD